MPVFNGGRLQKERESLVITDVQFALASMLLGKITEEEAEGWVARGEIPTVLSAYIDSIPSPVLRAKIRVKMAGAREIARLDPLIAPVQVAFQVTDEETDEIFRLGKTL